MGRRVTVWCWGSLGWGRMWWRGWMNGEADLGLDGAGGVGVVGERRGGQGGGGRGMRGGGEGMGGRGAGVVWGLLGWGGEVVEGVINGGAGYAFVCAGVGGDAEGEESGGV